MIAEKPIGTAYKILLGYSVIISKTGSFSGPNIQYTYPNTSFAIDGSFNENSNLIKGQKVQIMGIACTSLGMMELQYSFAEQDVVVYHYKPPSNASFGDQPQIPDELATEYLEVKRSDLHVEGLFAVKDIPKVDLRINV